MFLNEMDILIIDKDPVIPTLIEGVMSRDFPCKIDTAEDFYSAVSKFTSNYYHLVIMDYLLPGGSGLQLLREILNQSTDVPIIVTTEPGNEEMAAECFQVGASGYVLKNNDFEKNLLLAVRSAVNRKIEQKKYEDSIIDRDKRFRSLFEEAPNPIFEIDEKGKFLDSNSSALDFFGMDKKILSETNIYDLLRDYDYCDPDGFSLDFHKKITLEADFVIRKEIKTLFLNLVRVEVSGGVVFYAIGQDVTELKRAKYLILEKSKELTDLINIAAHELRHPATFFKGYSVLMLDNWDKMEEEVKLESLRAIDSASDRLSHFIDLMLDASKIEKSEFKPSVKVFHPEQMLVSMVDDFRSRYAEYRFVLDVNKIQRELTGDEELVRHAFEMIVENSIKYSESGSEITITLEKDNEFLVFRVADEGIGIPEEEIDKVFNRFYQVEGILHHSEGMGLGLYIVKSIILSHDGWIRVAPREGGGTILEFGLPAGNF